MRQPVQVAVYCVKTINNSPLYLMLKRNWIGRDFWQGVTGGVEDNETLEKAAIRELYEETGYRTKKLIQIDYIYKFPTPKDMLKLYDKHYEFITENSFLALIDSDKDPILDAVEHYEFRWCNFDKAMELLFWEGNKTALTHCNELLKIKLAELNE